MMKGVIFALNYIVLDMEWNQPFCKDATKVRNGVRLVGEIIQIGAVKLNSRQKITDTFEVKISPKIYTVMQHMVKEITGLTEGVLKNGISFRKAIDLFKTWCGDDHVILTWGMNDIPILRDNLKFFALGDNWIGDNYNAQCFFNKQTGNLGRQYSIDFAAEFMKIPVKSMRHDALNDAYYTALILSNLDIKKGIREYDTTVINGSNVIDENNLPKGAVFKKGFESKIAAASDKALLKTACTTCRKPLAMSKFVQHGSSRLAAMGVCKKCGCYAIKVKFRQDENKKYCFIKTMDLLNEKQKKDLLISLRKWSVNRQYLADRANSNRKIK